MPRIYYGFLRFWGFTMKRLLKFSFVFLVSICMFSCATTGPVPGMFYSDINGNKQFEAGLSSSPAGTWVTGKSCSYNVLLIAAWGDAGLDAALEAAGVRGQPIRNVAVDYSFMNIAGPIFIRYCTEVSAYIPIE